MQIVKSGLCLTCAGENPGIFRTGRPDEAKLRIRRSAAAALVVGLDDFRTMAGWLGKVNLAATGLGRESATLMLARRLSQGFRDEDSKGHCPRRVLR